MIKDEYFLLNASGEELHAGTLYSCAYVYLNCVCDNKRKKQELIEVWGEDLEGLGRSMFGTMGNGECIVSANSYDVAENGGQQ